MKSRIRDYLFNYFQGLMILLFVPTLLLAQYGYNDYRTFYEFTYGIADNRFGEKAMTFMNQNDVEVKTSMKDAQTGALGFAITTQFWSVFLMDIDIRYQNTALNGSDGYKIKYIEENNTDERVLDAEYVKLYIGFGLGTPSDFIFSGLIAGATCEYGSKLITPDLKFSYYTSYGVPNQVSIDDDFLLGYYFKYKLMKELTDGMYISITPSYHKTWKAVDKPIGTAGNWERTETEFVKAMDCFDIVIGFAFTSGF